ncbi:hypothetical protein [Xanthocytophaga agilis]|uniref:Uncharacterized protein n=1 Tax=Xanthocytophaga agilis TaxID=3048010 RepID=A0AAE3UJQ2_9BACT|nr:hypothetical protein [Xanthocytophaga agilis]MDJ1505533.1 hypothetical protein [Xanthocytophaga agilis]
MSINIENFQINTLKAYGDYLLFAKELLERTISPYFIDRVRLLAKEEGVSLIELSLHYPIKEVTEQDYEKLRGKRERMLDRLWYFTQSKPPEEFYRSLQETCLEIKKFRNLADDLLRNHPPAGITRFFGEELAKSNILIELEEAIKIIEERLYAIAEDEIILFPRKDIKNKKSYFKRTPKLTDEKLLSIYSGLPTGFIDCDFQTFCSLFSSTLITKRMNIKCSNGKLLVYFFDELMDKGYILNDKEYAATLEAIGFISTSGSVLTAKNLRVKKNKNMEQSLPDGSENIDNLLA